MGEIVEKPFPVQHERFIDYSLNGRTEFGDLYLGAKCAFCLGTSCGFMAIPQVFDRPVGIVNFVPVEYISTWVKGIAIWKHHMKDGKEMTLKEITAAELSQTTFGHDFAKAGVELKDNTPQEILEVAIEMANISEGRGIESQKEFWEDFPRGMVGDKPLHGEIKIRIGGEFLRNYENIRGDRLQS